MTATSDLIESLISYSWDDWQVTRQEARRVIAAIRNDNVPDATIAALDKSGSLIKLFQRVGPPELARSLIASIAGRTTMQRYQARNALIRSLINNPLGTQTDNWIYFPTITFFDICADLADAAGRLGFAAAGATGVASQAIQGPFSGVGATGVNPTDLPSIAFGDQPKLLNKDPATVTKYSNPLGDLGAYLSQLSPQDKLNQAQTLVGQPISTLFPDAYPGNPPSRAKVMSAAARKYDLTPQLIGAIILAEQRDQTRDEDAKDYQAAVSIKSANTSIGLGQVVVSTAIKYEPVHRPARPAGAPRSVAQGGRHPAGFRRIQHLRHRPLHPLRRQPRVATGPAQVAEDPRRISLHRSPRLRRQSAQLAAGQCPRAGLGIHLAALGRQPVAGLADVRRRCLRHLPRPWNEVPMKTVALILASLALLACTAESGVDFDKTLTHPNGLVVERPVGFDARRSAEGFRFDEGGKLRNPRQLEVQRQDAPPPPDLASRRLGDGEARYKVEEDDGGSAGSEYRLWAAKPAGARWIVVSASEQSEDGEPTFALAWALLERARLQ